MNDKREPVVKAVADLPNELPYSVAIVILHKELGRVRELLKSANR
jgi:hypothetical protein